MTIARAAAPLLLLLALAAGMLLRPLEPGDAVWAGRGDYDRLPGAHQPELSTADGRTFRWTRPTATLALMARGSAAHVLWLQLAAPQAAASATPVRLALGDRPLGTLPVAAAPRVYRVLVPAAAIGWGRNPITIHAPAHRTPGDLRDLGVVLFRAGWHSTAPADWLPPLQVASIGLAAALLAWALRRLGAGRARWLVVAGFVLISVAMRHSDLRFDQRWAATLLSVGLALAAGVAGLLARGPAAVSAPLPPPDAPWRWLVPALAGLALAPFTPLLAAGGGAILGAPGDNFEYLWKMAWFADALAARRSPTFVPGFFAPMGYELAHSELTPAQTLLAVPVTWIFGAQPAYLLWSYLSYVIGGIATLALARQLGAPPGGAFIAALGLTFGLFHMEHTMTQITVAGALPWIVVAWYGWERFLTRPCMADALLAGAGITLAAWSSWYYGPTLVLVLAWYTLGRVPWRGLPALAAAWRPLLALALLLATLLAPYAQPTLQLGNAGQVRHLLQNIVPHSATPWDFIEPSRYHVVWGRQAQLLAGGGDQPVAPGTALLLLAAIGWWRHRRRRIASALLLSVLGAWLFSLGPLLTIGTLDIPLPAYLINLGAPVLQSIRVWARMAFFGHVALAMLAALAFADAAPAARRLRRVRIALAGVALLELLNLAPIVSPVGPRPVDRWLAHQPAGQLIAALPDQLAGYQEYYARYHQQPLLVGYGTFVPTGWYAAVVRPLRDMPAATALQVLRLQQVRLAVIDRAALDRDHPGWDAVLATAPGVALAYEDATHRVYRLEGP
jgi:hypothetical protein